MSQYHEILQHIHHRLVMIFDNITIGISFIITCFCSLIGYPKDILNFIAILVFLDLITKLYSIVLNKYNDFTPRLFIQACKERLITSRALRIGTLSKLMVYLPFLIVANFINIVDELSLLKFFSNLIYVIITTAEILSLLENLISCTHGDLRKYLEKAKGKVSTVGDSAVGNTTDKKDNTHMEDKGKSN